MIVFARCRDVMIPILVDDDFSHQGKLSVASHGYVQATQPGAGRSVLRHRLLLGLQAGDPRRGDHINRDKLDSRMGNLRIVDPSVSNRNRRSSDNPYVGVRQVRSGRWQAALKWQRKTHYLGTFETRDEAAARIGAYRRDHCPGSLREGF